MDRRGYTVDPNKEACAELAWYEKIGPTQKPSPYATASWVYLQKYVVEMVDPCGVETTLGFDNYIDFSVWLYDFVLNGGEVYQDRTNAPVYDGGTISNTSFIKHIFASVKVYDSLASYPGDYADQDVDLGLLGIDSDQNPVEVPVVISPESLIGFDNGDNILVPIPNPQAIYDGGLFAQQGLGITLDGVQYQVSGDIQQIVQLVDAVFIDGSLVQADGDPNDEDFIEITRTAVPSDDVSPGKLLGEINYEMLNCKVRITDWSHYNWMDDTPVRKAFKAMVNSLPSQVSKEDISVRDRPHAFWTSLGFIQRNKGDEILYYNDPKTIKPY